MIEAFRADASLAIGAGHVMRCLTLADRLKARGRACVFISRDLAGNLCELVRERGHDVEVLRGRGIPYAAHEQAPFHAAWLECPWREDARQTRAALGRIGAARLVVDHYALDARWEQAVSAPGLRMMALDDLADRPHAVDMLLDQNLGREARDYAGLVPATCVLLVGPRHALTGPRFAELRAASLARRARPSLGRILVSMGGVDPADATSAALACIEAARLGPDASVLVVMGRHAPWLDKVRAAAAAMATKVEVAVDVRDMAERMAGMDLAIGGAGGTAWERCSLGLPSIVVVLAGNQRAGARALGAAGAAWTIDSLAELPTALPALLALAQDGAELARVSRRAADVADGLGAERVCDAWESAA